MKTSEIVAGSVYEGGKGAWLDVLSVSPYWRSHGDNRLYVDYRIKRQGHASRPAIGGTCLLKTFAKRAKRMVPAQEVHDESQ